MSQNQSRCSTPNDNIMDFDDFSCLFLPMPTDTTVTDAYIPLSEETDFVEATSFDTFEAVSKHDVSTLQEVSDCCIPFSDKEACFDKELLNTSKDTSQFFSKDNRRSINVEEKASVDNEFAIEDKLRFKSFVKKATRRKSTSPRWTEMEEIILQGVVIDCALAFGGQSTWGQVCRCYNIVVSRIFIPKGLKPQQKRTICSIKKHYRIMHSAERMKEISAVDSSKGYWFEVYHKKWMSKDYNKNNRLLKYKDIIAA